MLIIGDLTAAIASGALDADLGTIAAAVKLRQQHTVLQGMVPGARVKLTTVKPKYLAGITGEIIMVPGGRNNRYVMRIDDEFVDDAGRFIDPVKHTIRVTPGMVTVLQDTP